MPAASAFAVLLALLAFTVLATTPPPLDTPGVTEEAGGEAASAYGKLPPSFIPNRGQTDSRVRYYAQGSGNGVFFQRDRVTFSFEKGEQGAALELRFMDANPSPALAATERLPGRMSDLKGPASRHRTNLPSYGALTYRDLWPGIDLIFRARGEMLKYEFHVAPGADPSRIGLAYAGADGLALGAGGNLLIDTPVGVIRDSRPRSHQRIGGQRRQVDSRYKVATGRNSYGFTLGAGYERSRPLVIDPGLEYSTFIDSDHAIPRFAIAIDASGSAYMTGQTFPHDFPTTPGAFDTTGNGDSDVFVAKLNPAGTSLDYATLLGGRDSDTSFGIAVDAAGSAYVTGQTYEDDFPTTPGALQTTFGDGGVDAFVTKLNPSGTALDYSTFLGRNGSDAVTGVSVDSDGSAYLTGWTNGNLPTSPGAFAATHSGVVDAFVMKLNAAGTGFHYSTFLGGRLDDWATGIGFDDGGNAYVAGRTRSDDFPTTLQAFQATHGGGYDGFLAKLNATGSGLVYSTYLGGSSVDEGMGVAVDGAGNAYTVGWTASADFPTTPGAFDPTFNGEFSDAFVTQLDAAGTGVTNSTYLGGSGDDLGYAVAAGTTGHVHVTGVTGSADFPITADALGFTPNVGPADAFVTELNPADSTLEYSTYLGGSAWDSGLAIAVDAGGTYVVGETASADFPTTAGAFDVTFNSPNNAFVTKFDSGTSTPDCKVDGKGRLASNRQARFDVRAAVDDAGGPPQGRISYTDSAVSLRFDSTEIASLTVTGDEATLRGSGLANRQPVSFRISLTDGRPRRFGIELSSAYAAAGDVRSGRITIRCS